MREVGICPGFSEGYLHKRYRAYHAQGVRYGWSRYGLNELGGEECSLCGPDGVYKGSAPDPDCHGEDEHFRMNKVRRICDGWNMGNAPAVHGFGEACIQGSISSGTASGQMDDHHSFERWMIRREMVNTTEDQAMTEDQAEASSSTRVVPEDKAAASSSTRVGPSAKAAPAKAQLDEWAIRPSAEKRHLMLEAWKTMQGNRWKLGIEIFKKMQKDEDKEAL